MKTKPLFLLAFLLLGAQIAGAQGTAFTYNGRLNIGTNPANGTYDLTFALFSTVSGPGQLAPTQTNSAMAINGGLFTALLDFGANFPGADRWLEITARTNGTGPFTPLTPRQKLTPTPYSITAGNLSGILPASQISGALPPTVSVPDARLSPNVPLLSTNQTFSGTNNFTGRVSIGTNAPAAQLHVAGLGTNSLEIIENLGDAATSLSFKTLYRTWRVGQNRPPDATNTLDSFFIHDSTAGLTRFMINPSGFVGIGATNPASILDISTGAGNVRFRNESGITPSLTIANSPNPGVMRFRNHLEVWPNDAATDQGSIDIRNTTGAATISLPASGNAFFTGGQVGVGLNNPSAQLHVSSTGGDSNPQLWIDQSNPAGYVRMRMTQGNNYGNRWDMGMVSNRFNIYSGYLGHDTVVMDNHGINAVGGLVIENRTSDPPSPVTGQIWIRTDL